MSVSNRRATFRSPVRAIAPVDVSDRDPERLQQLVCRIAERDRGAFAELFDRCGDRVRDHVCRQVNDPYRVAGVVAGTFVEVWWLAAHFVGQGTDVVAWIDQIVRRRVADSRPAASSPVFRAEPEMGGVNSLWWQYVWGELAALLGHRLPAWLER